MQLRIPAVVLAVVLPALAQGPTFLVNTPPSCSQCGACSLSWTETPKNAPFMVAFVAAAQTASTPLINPVTVNDTTVTFLSPFQLNQQVTTIVTDSTGMKQFSSPWPTVAGSTSSCVGNSSFNAFPNIPGYTVGGSTSGSSGPPGSSSSGGSSPTVTTSGGASSSSSGAKSSSTSTSTSPSGSPSQTNSASTLSASLIGSISLIFVALIA